MEKQNSFAAQLRQSIIREEQELVELKQAHKQLQAAKKKRIRKQKRALKVLDDDATEVSEA